jgi:hypothetical protein
MALPATVVVPNSADRWFCQNVIMLHESTVGVFTHYYEYGRRKVTRNSVNISDGTEDEILRLCWNYGVQKKLMILRMDTDF